MESLCYIAWMQTFVLFNIYLFYGLVFFTIGCVVVFRNFKYSQLKISSTLWALALFGFFHAFHEWSELFVLLFSDNIEPHYQVFVRWLRLFKLLVSFLALMVFSWQLLAITYRMVALIGHGIICLLFGLYALELFHSWPVASLTELAFVQVSQTTRMLIGFGSAFMAGVGFIIYGHQLKLQAQPYGRYFIASGLGFIVYGVLSGLVPTDMHQTVPIFRTLAATIILFALYRALRFFDIEKERITEAKLKRAVEADKFNAMGQLATGVAHEINNPLASSTLALDLLSRSPALLTEQQGNYIERVRTGIDRAAAISKELLSYARPASEQQTPINLHDVIELAISLLAHRCKNHHINLDGDNDLVLLGQRVKLEELFINLISNAVDASAQGAAIDIKWRQKDGRVQVTVADHGEGMSQSQLERIREPFFSTKEMGKGTGLGLAICENIVALHCGQMDIHSQVGIGTQVCIEFKNRESHGTSISGRR